MSEAVALTNVRTWAHKLSTARSVTEAATVWEQIPHIIMDQPLLLHIASQTEQALGRYVDIPGTGNTIGWYMKQLANIAETRITAQEEQEEREERRRFVRQELERWRQRVQADVERGERRRSAREAALATGRLLYSVKEAAEVLDVGVNHCYQLIHEGQIPAVHAPGPKSTTIKVRADALQVYVESLPPVLPTRG